jgi:hypothetical protein
MLVKGFHISLIHQNLLIALGMPDALFREGAVFFMT